MIAPDLLQMLVCPECRQPLSLITVAPTRAGAPGNDALKCAACRRVYPIRDGIPILLVDEAKIDES